MTDQEFALRAAIVAGRVLSDAALKWARFDGEVV